jgi:hypothetical protein
MVYVSTETPYMVLFKDFLAKKHRLAIDSWGADDRHVKQHYDPLISHIASEVPKEYQDLYPFPVWRFESRITKITRTIMFAEFLIREWAEHFKDKSEAELDEIAQSFKFENCLKRDELNEILMEDAKQWK